MIEANIFQRLTLEREEVIGRQVLVEGGTGRDDNSWLQRSVEVPRSEP